jgi:hypothetical protein
MTFCRLATLVCASLVFCLGLVTASPAAQQREASKEVRSKLFKQLLAENRELRECIEAEEGGALAAEEKTTVEEVDLNRDGIPEYEVGLSSPCECGMVNCSIYVYRQVGRGYELILDDASGMGLELLKTSSKGYLDLRVDARNNAATYSTTKYKFDGKKYRDVGTMVVHHETGETKPASRRIQFKRGMSSTTVQGKASLAMPDIYLVGARAGQTITLQLTAPRKSVRFSLMSPKTESLVFDIQRSWTGTLPETGDYTILVDGDEKGSTYSMTISIK